MYVSLWMVQWVFAARTYLALEPTEHLDAARHEIAGNSFWVLRDPSRPLVPWREARDDDAIGYRVLAEVGLEAEIPRFVESVAGVLADARSWSSAGREFVRVDSHQRFFVVLARPETVDRLCRPLRTAGIYSCGRNGRATLNSMRWLEGASPWGEDIDGYRMYMINHEVGHLLGMPHQDCHDPGQPADVMVQQTKGLGGCTASSWPSQTEIERLQKRWKN